MAKVKCHKKNNMTQENLHSKKLNEFSNVFISNCLTNIKQLTYGDRDDACGDSINQKNFEVHQACSSDEDDFNTIIGYSKKNASYQEVPSQTEDLVVIWLPKSLWQIWFVQWKNFTEIWPGLMCTTSPSWILKICWLLPPLTTIKMQSASGFKEMNQMRTANIYTKPLTQRLQSNNKAIFTVMILAMKICVSMFHIFACAWNAWHVCERKLFLTDPVW